jgi:hypothetical protein
MDPCNIAEREDPSLDFGHDPTEVSGYLWRKVREGVDVYA